MSMVKEIPQINGRDLKVAEIDGPNGRFEVALFDVDKDGDYCFFYRDPNSCLYFYPKRARPLPGKASINGFDIQRATIGARSGGSFRTTQENEAVIKQNIEFFFKTRFFINPWELGDESTAALSITFSWRMV